MNDHERMRSLKQDIARVFADKERLKNDLDLGRIKPNIGLRRLEAIDNELSKLDTQYKLLWDKYYAPGNSATSLT